MGHQSPKKEVKAQRANKSMGVVRVRSKANGLWEPKERG